MKASNFVIALRLSWQQNAQLRTINSFAQPALRRVQGYAMACVLILTCPVLVAGETNEEIDFFEFLADFHDDDQWIDPLEIEAWGDRRLRRSRPARQTEPDQELEENNDLERVYEHRRFVDQTPVMDETGHETDEESYDED